MSQIPTVIGSKKNEIINNENSSSNVVVKSRNDVNGSDGSCLFIK